MTTNEFREEMERLTERIIRTNETLEVGQWVDFGRIQNDFNDLATKYLDIEW